MLRCDHCLLEFPEGQAVSLAQPPKVFCCAGCRGVYLLIHGAGLDAFYERRRWDEAGLACDPQQPVEAGAFRPATRTVDGLAELDLYVDGLRCASCVWLTERLLASLPGVRYARVSYAAHRARVRWDPAEVSLEEVLGRIRGAGYEPKPYSESERQRSQEAETRDLLVRLGTAFFLSSQLMIYSVALYAGYFQGIEPGLRRLLEWIALALTLPVFLYSGAPFLRSAARAVRARRFDMDSLIVLGSGAALAYSVGQMARGGEVYFDTAAMIVTLVLAGRYVEARARGRASEAVARLGALLPASARVAGRGAVPLAQVAIGDRVEVRPGERVPLDGTVLEGASEVDEAVLTGESRPVVKGPGGAVIGGTLNLHGAFSFEVTRRREDTVLAGIVRAVERAQEQKPRIQAFADRVTAVFVPAVLLLSVATVAGHLLRGAPAQHALMTGVAVVVIACPCSLGLATPIAALLATGAASARGVLVKGVDVLERLAAATDAVLDKTGTLTRGRPALREVLVLEGRRGRDELVALAAAAERGSEHSLGRALVEAGRALAPAPAAEGFTAVPGQGVAATVGGARILLGNRALLAAHALGVPDVAALRAAELEAGGDTVVYLAVDGEVAALLAIADLVRDEAREALARLRAQGVRTWIVSGDARRTTEAVAAGLGVDAVVAEVSPVGKAEHVAALQRGGRRVLVVGDGVNDAPALTRADVGVAMKRATDVTMESADAVLVREDLRLVPGLVGLARRTRRVVRQNVFWAFFYNAVAIPLAVAGVLHPIVAAAAMASSSLFVVGNSLRVRSWT